MPQGAATATTEPTEGTARRMTTGDTDEADTWLAGLDELPMTYDADDWPGQFGAAARGIP